MQVQVDLRSIGESDRHIGSQEVLWPSSINPAVLRGEGADCLNRQRGLHRLFHPKVLERLALIALGRSAGFSRDEIALMFTPDGSPHINRQMLTAKADEFDRTIRRLTAMRDGLLHAAACSAPSHMECPKFQRILRAAAPGSHAGTNSTAQPPRS
jgi:hypothetical protein